jgi:hypothetical protein
MSSLPASFAGFTSLFCDREAFIVDYLKEHGIRTSIIALGYSRHIYVHFASQAYDPSFRLKTVVAHYDRFPGSPGANDNSAAVWQLMDWAARLRNFPGAHNVRIIFTGDEEPGASDGVKGLGAFGIAGRLKTLGCAGGDVYVFDCCGRGGVIVLSKPEKRKVAGGSAEFRRRFRDLYARSEALLNHTAPRSWRTLPVPYSDNAGFIAQGIPAVLITALPTDEAAGYARALSRDKRLEELVLNKGGAADPLVRGLLPETWRLMHTSLDTDASLTPETFLLMANLLDRLAQTR